MYRTPAILIAAALAVACAPEPPEAPDASEPPAAPEPAPPADLLAALPELPDGLIDAHYHIRGVGERELTLDLAGTRDLESMLARVAEYAARYPDLEWITGRGWIETHYDPPEFPTREDLDRVVPDRPMYLTRADGHAGLANTRALEIAGITRDTEAPFGGKILTDAHGEPNGMLIDNAQELVREHIPADGRPDIRVAIRTGGEYAARMGWSGVHAILDGQADVEAIRTLYERDAMPVEIYAAVRWPGEAADKLLEEGPTLINEYDGRFTVRAIKINFDGALGSRGAALLEPYADDPGNRGHLTHTPEELKPVLEQALRNGVQVWTHAIGDRANRIALDLYEEAFNKVPEAERAVADPRWRIEHAQHLTAEDIPRFAELGVIASMQPSHAIGDLHFAPRRLGMERLRYAYAWRDLIDSGAIVIGGSDAPVEVGDPRIEFHAATTRTDLDGYSGEGWHPEQAVNWEEAVRMFRDWVAMASFESSTDQFATDSPENILNFANMRPNHAMSNMLFTHRRLCYERLKYAYIWRSLLDAGATTIIGGSDAQVEVGDLCIEFHAVTTRTDLNGLSHLSWHRELALPVHLVKQSLMCS